MVSHRNRLRWILVRVSRTARHLPSSGTHRRLDFTHSKRSGLTWCSVSLSASLFLYLFYCFVRYLLPQVAAYLIFMRAHLA